jgi:enolase
MLADSIAKVKAREVLDSRGSPTVEVEIHCQGGAWGRAIVPSGASTGRHEAKELRDGGSRYGGRGVRRAVANVRDKIAPHLSGRPASAQRDIDRLLLDLDGTPDKSNLGANATLGVSLACAHAAASAKGLPLWRYLDREGGARLPLPMINLVSGGLHAGGNLDFQDFLLIPSGARSYSEALEMTARVYHFLSGYLMEKGYEGVLVGDEGGFGPKLPSNEEAVELIIAAVERAGFTPGRDAGIALDVASSHFFEQGKYRLQKRLLSSTEMSDMLAQWVDAYPILSIEDGMAEDDWEGWKRLTATLGSRVQLVGDDLFVTNAMRLQKGIEEGVANSVLIKPNQIGTLTETLDVIGQARAAGYRPVVSARSGETEDTTIADLAVATGVGQIKIGSVARSERLAKYNQLLRIEEEGLPFAGWEPL